MFEEKNEIIRRSVAFNPRDIKIVEKIVQKKGIGSFSGALRLIIREWDEIQLRHLGEEVSITTASQSNVQKSSFKEYNNG